MSKLLPGLAIGLSLAVFPVASLVLPASAKDQTVTVTIGDELAAQLADLGVQVVPDSVTVPRGIANTVCDQKVEAGATCEAVAGADLLADFLTSDDDDDSSESSEEPNANSARAFAPGQLKGDDESAKTYAPGQNREDGGSARDEAPGQQKGGDDDGE